MVQSKKPIGVLYDVLVKVDQFILSSVFVIIDCKIDHEVSIILNRPFLAFKMTIVDMKSGEMKFWVNYKEVFFNVCKSIKSL